MLEGGSNCQPKSVRSGNGADDESARTHLEGHGRSLQWWDAAEIIGVSDRTMRRGEPVMRSTAITGCTITASSGRVPSVSRWRPRRRCCNCTGRDTSTSTCGKDRRRLPARAPRPTAAAGGPRSRHAMAIAARRLDPGAFRRTSNASNCGAWPRPASSAPSIRRRALRGRATAAAGTAGLPLSGYRCEKRRSRSVPPEMSALSRTRRVIYHNETSGQHRRNALPRDARFSSRGAAAKPY
jgi:hypothetical protein